MTQMTQETPKVQKPRKKRAPRTPKIERQVVELNHVMYYKDSLGEADIAVLSDIQIVEEVMAQKHKEYGIASIARESLLQRILTNADTFEVAETPKETEETKET